MVKKFTNLTDLSYAKEGFILIFPKMKICIDSYFKPV